MDSGSYLFFGIIAKSLIKMFEKLKHIGQVARLRITKRPYKAA